MTYSTTPTDPSPGWDRFDRGLRAIAVAVVFGVVVAAALGVGGLTTASRSARSGDLAATVHFASVSRPGIATPLRIDVSTIDGSDLGAVTVRVPRRYLDLFDENGLAPEPTGIEADAHVESWVYEDVRTSVLSIDFDARLQPNAHRSSDASIVVSRGSDSVSILIGTRVMP